MNEDKLRKIERMATNLRKARCAFLVPVLFLASGHRPTDQIKIILNKVGTPLLAIVIFLTLWNAVSAQIVTKYGAVPGPREVASAWGSLMNEARLERIKEREYQHRSREKRLQALESADPMFEKFDQDLLEFDEAAVQDALTKMTAAFERISTILDVPQSVVALSSQEDAEAFVNSFKDPETRELAQLATKKLLPVELEASRLEAALTGPGSEPTIKEQRRLAAQKSKALIARQQLTTDATKLAISELKTLPPKTTRTLKTFDRSTTALGTEITQYYEQLEELQESTGEKSPELFKAKLMSRAFDIRPYPGKETYIQQIATSLKTVFFGFFIASAIAIPIGVLCGLSPSVNNALNPFIQLFKPVSPLAWLPIVMIVVGAVVTADDPVFELSFINSAITVALCCLWPTLVNTAVGVASTDKDFLNVAKVLKLGWAKRIYKIILPSALPLMFTGLRLSLGVGWMVLIAAEMLAQNPGLGKFVWDMFQNGSSQTLSMIMVAVFTIGIIGLLLDNLMLALQRLVTFDAKL